MWHPFTNASWQNCHPGQVSPDRHNSTRLHISTLLACRLVQLKKKDNGIRPGVGECLWRIIGKTIIGLLKEDIIHAVGTLQTCAGLESGIEAATNAVRKSYEEEKSECLLLVHADNAFNKLNRKVSLENIKRLCPPMSRIYTVAVTHPPCFIWKMGSTYCHRRVWHKGTMQQWQCTLYPCDHW